MQNPPSSLLLPDVQLPEGMDYRKHLFPVERTIILASQYQIRGSGIPQEKKGLLKQKISCLYNIFGKGKLNEKNTSVSLKKVTKDYLL